MKVVSSLVACGVDVTSVVAGAVNAGSVLAEALTSSVVRVVAAAGLGSSSPSGLGV